MSMTTKQTILIVDDAPENIRILSELLKAEYTVRAATNGEKALCIAASDNPPDLILLDIVMPGMDGYEVCRNLKSDSQTKNIPVIFITARESEQDEVKGFEAGAVDYVTKPFNPVVVKARVNTHAELKKYRDYLENTSYSDGLTGISNRRHFNEYYETVWNLAARESSPISLIMIDIDFFKQYNDHYGHQLGDDCLIKIAQKLSESVKRKVDLVVRYGGEEFVCILPKTPIEDAVNIAEALRKNVLSLQIPHAFSAAGEYVTVSLGVTTATPDKDTLPDSLIKAADEALYKSKESGRDRVSVIA